MQMQLHSFLVPHLRRFRFHEAIRVNGHKVVPLWPGPNDDVGPELSDIFDDSVNDESIGYVEEREAEIAFPTGAINQTVVEVTTALGQDFMDELNLDRARAFGPRMLAAASSTISRLQPCRMASVSCEGFAS